MSTGVANVLRRVIAGRTLKFEFDPPQMQYMDSFQAVGGKIWPASDLMLKYFEATSFVKDKSVLELGSGCGLVGIGCAVLGARSVTLTDRTITQRSMIYDAEGMLVDQELPPNRILLDLCEQNIANNAAVTENCSFDVAELEWGSANQRHLDKLFGPTGTGTRDSEQKHFDLIVGSDVTYHSNISEQLFWTVSQLLRRQRNSPLQASQHLKNTISANNTSGSSIDSRANNLAAATVEALPLRFVAAHQHRLRTATANCLIAAQEAGLKCRVLAANYDPSDNSNSRSSRSSSGSVIGKDDGYSGVPFDENTMIMLREAGASSGAATDAGKEPPKLLLWEFTPI
jgi:hypothetical protein